MKIVDSLYLSKLGSFDEERMPFVFSERYAQYEQKALNHTHLLFYDEKTDALLPALKSKVKFFSILQPVFAPVTLKGERLSVEDEKHFLDEFVNYVAAQKIASRITQSPSHALFAAVPDNSVHCHFGTYIADLKNNTEEELFSKIHSRTRRYIKAMDKNGVVINWGLDTLEHFYGLYKETMQRTNMYYEPLSQIKEMVNYLKESHILVGVAYWHDKPQGSLLVAHSRYGAFSLYAGSAEHIEHHGTMHYLYWDAMRLMKEENVNMFDCVGARISNVSGSKLDGIQNFKEKLCVNLVKGFLWKKDINVMQCRFFDSLIRTKQLLSGKKAYKDIIDQEIEKT